VPACPSQQEDHSLVDVDNQFTAISALQILTAQFPGMQPVSVTHKMSLNTTHESDHIPR
jgi:hypothetical protein